MQRECGVTEEKSLAIAATLPLPCLLARNPQFYSASGTKDIDPVMNHAWQLTHHVGPICLASEWLDVDMSPFLAREL